MADNPSAMPASHSTPESKPVVLLVDDLPANLKALRATLDGLGPELVDARSGDEALGWLQSSEAAVILLDVNMPGRDGFETARLIRARDESRLTPIIFVTADDIDRE